MKNIKVLLTFLLIPLMLDQALSQVKKRDLKYIKIKNKNVSLDFKMITTS